MAALLAGDVVGAAAGAWLRRAALLLGVMVLTVAPWTTATRSSWTPSSRWRLHRQRDAVVRAQPHREMGADLRSGEPLPRRQRDVETLKQLAKDPAAVARLERSAPPSRGGEKTEVESARALATRRSSGPSTTR